MPSRLYFDYAATTPVDPKVKAAMRPYFEEKFGNPGSLHSFGQEAIRAIDEARETIAKATGAPFRGVIFTGSATEANNLALRGVFQVQKSSGKTGIIISSIEHESVLETARDLEKNGAEVAIIPVNAKGVVDLAALHAAISERTAIVSLMHTNNEIGTIQPIKEIAAILESLGDKRPVFHTDAVQAFQFLDCDMSQLGVDLMTISAHKIYGPKGVGALILRDPKIKLHPTITGGGQEYGMRSGTENVSSVAGFGEAVQEAREMREKESARLRDLSECFIDGIKKIAPDAEIYGENRVPSIVNIFFPRHRAEELLTALDQAGIAISSGSACRSRSAEPSHVIEALGFGKERAKHSIRFSFGRPTTKTEIDEALPIIGKLLSTHERLTLGKQPE